MYVKPDVDFDGAERIIKMPLDSETTLDGVSQLLVT
jgi:hypothetical protein